MFSRTLVFGDSPKRCVRVVAKWVRAADELEQRLPDWESVPISICVDRRPYLPHTREFPSCPHRKNALTSIIRAKCPIATEEFPDIHSIVPQATKTGRFELATFF